jgi:hypothetical protein
MGVRGAVRRAWGTPNQLRLARCAHKPPYPSPEPGEERVQLGPWVLERAATPTLVIPAQAGIHLLTSRNRNHLEMDSRLRGNDEGERE